MNQRRQKKKKKKGAVYPEYGIEQAELAPIQIGILFFDNKLSQASQATLVCREISSLPTDLTRKSYLQRVEFQAENILIRAADLGKLYEGVLNAASKGDGLTQQWWVIPEFILEEAKESRKTLLGVFTLYSTSSKDTSDREWNKRSIWCSAPSTQLSKMHFRLHQC